MVYLAISEAFTMIMYESWCTHDLRYTQNSKKKSLMCNNSLFYPLSDNLQSTSPVPSYDYIW